MRLDSGHEKGPHLRGGLSLERVQLEVDPDTEAEGPLRLEAGGGSPLAGRVRRGSGIHRLLDHLKVTDVGRYQALIETLGLRR